MPLIWMLGAASLFAVPGGYDGPSAAGPFGKAPMADQALAPIRGSGLPMVGIDQAAAMMRTAEISAPRETRPSDTLREVTDNWNFHEGADLIIASMTARSQSGLSEQSQSNAETHFRLQIGTLVH